MYRPSPQEGDLRRRLEDDYLQTMKRDHGSTNASTRALAARPTMSAKFGRATAARARHLTRAIQDLVEFREDDGASRFRLHHVPAHAGMGITREDAEAIRREFVAEVIATFERSGGNVSPQMHGDAWNAVSRRRVERCVETRYRDDAGRRRGRWRR